MLVAVGPAIGPNIAGMIYGDTQSYSEAFTLFAGLCLLAVIIAILLAKTPAENRFHVDMSEKG